MTVMCYPKWELLQTEALGYNQITAVHDLPAALLVNPYPTEARFDGVAGS